MSNPPCPCGSQRPYRSCCQVYISGAKPAPTAEALMRSRYTAFTTNQVAYLVQTRHPDYCSPTETADISAWIAEVSEWESLEILISERGQPTDNTGIVAFNVTVKQNRQRQTFYECSRFSKHNGNWLYEVGI